MASIIKNQIIKHLSAFARNLTPDQISVEILRGKGELKDIVLNESILTERLELPAWLKIVRATCNRVSVKVPWTKLKTSAVELEIDEIEVVLSLSASSTSAPVKKTNAQNGKPYDYAERVIEGLSINIQTLTVYFKSDCFGGSVMFQRVSVASKSPNFTDEKDLHMTRVHDKSIRQLLFFKQITWGMCKIEASALRDTDANVESDGTRRNALNSPLRLIMHNGGKCKISIKKNDLNCSVISSRIEVCLDEILWVATLLQLRSVIEFYKHIQSLVKVSEQKKNENFLIDNMQPKSLASTNVTPCKTAGNNPISLAFKKYNIRQSSHHLYISKIDICLFDDSTDDLLPKDWGINNGAIQAVLHELRVDLYPSHVVYCPTENGAIVFSDRSDWVHYNPLNSCRKMAERHFTNFYSKLSENMESELFSRIQRIWPSLHSQNVVVRIEDIVVQCVSEQNTKKDSIQQLFWPSKLRRFSDIPILPTISFFHMELTSYYFLASSGYPLPPDSTHIVMSPLEFLADSRSIRWIVYVFENILNAFDERSTQSLSMCDINQPFICVEFVEPTVVLNVTELLDDSRLPKRFLLNFSTLTLCNYVLSTTAMKDLTCGDELSNFVTLDELVANCLQFSHSKQSQLQQFFNPNELAKRIRLFSNTQQYANSIDSMYRKNDDIRLYIDIPSVSFSSDFGENSFEIPITSEISLLAVVALKQPLFAVLIRPRSDVNVLIDHFQFVRLMQLQTQIADLLNQIDVDRQFFAKFLPNAAIKNDDVPFAILCDIPRVNVSLILLPGALISPYDLKWSPTLMTKENTSDSIVMPSLRAGQQFNGGGADYNEIRNQMDHTDRSEAVNTNLFGNTNPFFVEDEDIDTITAKVEAQISTSLNSKDLRNSASASSLTNFTLANRHIANANNDSSAMSARSASFANTSPQYVRNIARLQSSSRQGMQLSSGLHRADFSTGSLISADIERASLNTSIFDDTASISTTTCDYQRFLNEDVDITSIGRGAAGGIWGLVDDAELVEEADAIDERNRWADVERKLLARSVNVLDANLNHVNAIVVIGGSTDTLTKTKIAVFGDVASVSIDERLHRICGDVYKESAIAASESRKRTTTKNGVESTKEVHFHAKVNEKKEAIIQINVDGAGKIIRLSDEVVSHLGPFTENSELKEEPPNPPELRLNVSNLDVEVKNMKKKHALRIRLGSAISINDGPALDDADFS